MRRTNYRIGVEDVGENNVTGFEATWWPIVTTGGGGEDVRGERPQDEVVCGRAGEGLATGMMWDR
jgi:hypothetical protein